MCDIAEKILNEPVIRKHSSEVTIEDVGSDKVVIVLGDQIKKCSKNFRLDMYQISQVGVYVTVKLFHIDLSVSSSFSVDRCSNHRNDGLWLVG